MKPKRIKDLLPHLAQQFDLSEKEIASVLDAYWDNVRKTLSSLEHNRIYMKGLGTFYIKPWSIDKKMRINDAVIGKYADNPTAGGLQVIDQLFKDNMKLKNVQEKEEEFKKQKNKKKNDRHNQTLEGEG